MSILDDAADKRKDVQERLDSTQIDDKAKEQMEKMRNKDSNDSSDSDKM
ncbi:MAG TPA: hypothetical protein VF575_01005 [Candidatus Saccharimonadales bacterium]|jgi:hypothetical protein